MTPLAIIPARAGSKGIPNKNFRAMAGISPVERAALVAGQITNHVVISSDNILALANWQSAPRARLLPRPAALATDESSMIDVVRHVLDCYPGDPMQPILLIQPTQPLRTPEHIRQALALLTPEVDSVVSVVEVPRTHHPEAQIAIRANVARPWYWQRDSMWRLPSARQEMSQTFIRDGSCYAFHRRTVEKHGDLYGHVCVPLIIPASETCALDEPSDWAEAERRLRKR